MVVRLSEQQEAAVRDLGRAIDDLDEDTVPGILLLGSLETLMALSAAGLVASDPGAGKEDDLRCWSLTPLGRRWLAEDVPLTDTMAIEFEPAGE
jgi:hypothetical protein